MLPYIASPAFTVYPTIQFLSWVYSIPQSSTMASEPEKLGVTEIKVRMDCNGCVQKIKKALHGIIGIYELYVDFSQQKVIIVGWADPEKIVKAIKKTRKSAVICSHTEQSEESAEPPMEQPPEGGSPEGGPPPPDTNQAAEPQQSEGVPPPEQQAPDNPPPPEPESSLDSTSSARSQSTQPSLPKDAEEIPDYRHRYPYGQNVHQGYDGPWYPHPGVPRFRGEPSQPPQPVSMSHSYNTYKPSPYITESQPPQPAPMSHNHNTYRPSPYLTEPQPSQPVPVSHSYNTYRQSPLVTESTPVQSVHVSHSYNTYRPSMFVTESQPVQPEPVSVRHSYNTYKPSPYVTEYAHPRPPSDYYSHYGRADNSGPEVQGFNYNTYKPPPYAPEYAYPRSPPSSYSRYGSPSPPSYYSHYTRPDNFSQEYHNGIHGNGNVTSMFSEENPNACTIV